MRCSLIIHLYIYLVKCLTHKKLHPLWYMAYIALILHVNGVPMIIIGIPACIRIHPACILHIKDSVCIELLGVLCTPLKNIGGARAPLAPPFLHLWYYYILKVAPKLKGKTDQQKLTSIIYNSLHKGLVTLNTAVCIPLQLTGVTGFTMIWWSSQTTYPRKKTVPGPSILGYYGLAVA